MTKPRVISPCVAERCNSNRDERIVEFSANEGGGLISIRNGNDEAIVELYRLDPRVRVVSPAPASPLVAALQWLLDDMSDADETHSPTGEIFASVECAAAALVNAGGSLSWYTPEQAKAYAESHP